MWNIQFEKREEDFEINFYWLVEWAAIKRLYRRANGGGGDTATAPSKLTTGTGRQKQNRGSDTGGM